jgi:hypothetical protein
MAMTLGDGFSRLELSVIEVQPPVPGATPGGDVCLSVAVRFDAFAGAASAWIDRDAWAEFVAQLQRLEQARRGEAILESITPGELRLRFHSLDLAGHMGVEGELVRFRYHRGGSGAVRLQFPTVEFDPGMLASLVAELRSATVP